MIPGSKTYGEAESARALGNPVGALLLDRKLFSRRSLIIGLVCTLLFHLLGAWVVPGDLFDAESSEIKNQYKEYQIELVEDVPEEEEEVYTQTNPDVPDNVPDDTNRFAARNQQAANEVAPEELDPNNRPASESEDDIDTDQFLTGDLTEPIPTTPPSEAQEQVDPTEAARQSLAQKKAIPIFGALDESDPDQEGIAENDFEEELEEAPTNVVDLFEGDEEEGEEDAVETQNESESESTLIAQDYAPPSPRPRPQLPKVASGPVRNSPLGVSKVGKIAVDAKFSEFGEYMERLIEVVSVRWNYLASERASKERNSVVRISFTLTKDGFVSNIATEPSTTSKAIGIYVARAAVQEGSPYGVWTSEMVEVFGNEETVNFSFHYY